MHCSNCGQEINSQAVVCVHCGVRVQQQPSSADGSIGGLGIICFLFPVVGLILYLVWKDSMPFKARGAGKAALWGFIIGIVGSILYWIIMFAAIAGSV